MYRFIITLWWFIIFDRLLSVTPHTLVFHKDLYWDPFNLVRPNVNIQLYADDTVIYADGCTKQQVASKLNNTMRHITVWLNRFSLLSNCIYLWMWVMFDLDSSDDEFEHLCWCFDIWPCVPHEFVLDWKSNWDLGCFECSLLQWTVDDKPHLQS